MLIAGGQIGLATAQGANPVPFPRGHDVPTPRSTIEGWVQDGDFKNIYLHAWNIWSGLTAPSGEDGLLVFETWPTLEGEHSLILTLPVVVVDSV
ncbi:hypothetical protein, partial [Candidatus Entotheonella palauensis]|uniref:hypothetical protein n=1 Tax=Candidatus Entotheonella palauensis TaxID=93172 RepID=UPI001178C487